jgi:ribosome-associated protein
MMIIPAASLDHELKFSFSKSSGPGGQHVNKVNTKVELRFSVEDSSVLNEEQKLIIKAKLSSKINQLGELIVIAQEKRSQIQNKELAIEKFYNLINKALIPRKKRLRSQVTRASKEKRLKLKKEHAEKKSRRKWNP